MYISTNLEISLKIFRKHKTFYIIYLNIMVNNKSISISYFKEALFVPRHAVFTISFLYFGFLGVFYEAFHFNWIVQQAPENKAANGV